MRRVSNGSADPKSRQMRCAFRHKISQRKMCSSGGNSQKNFCCYGNVMNPQNVTNWCREFSEGRTDVHDEQRSSRPSLISDDLLQETEGEIRANGSVTIRELHHIIPEVSKTTIHEAVTEKLGYRKLCARWLPKLLTDDHKTKRMGSALKFLARYAQETDEFLYSIVTGFPLVSSPKETSRWEKVRRR